MLILLSSFSENEKKVFGKKIKENFGTYMDTPFYQSNCDIIICKKPTRGEKFLCGCAAGKPLVIPQYIEDCLKEKCWLHPDPYEWRNQNTKQYEELLIQLPNKCLEFRKNSYMGVFGHWKVLLHVEPGLKAQAYKRLLASGGAKVKRKKPPFNKEMKNHFTHIFSTKDKMEDVRIFNKYHFKDILYPEYIAEYLVNYPSPPPLEKFMLFLKKEESPKKKATPRKAPKQILNDKQMKTQRRITELFQRKRKSDNDEFGPTKKLCMTGDILNTPEKQSNVVSECLHSPVNIKQEPISPFIVKDGNKKTPIVISLLSEDEEENEETVSDTARQSCSKIETAVVGTIEHSTNEIENAVIGTIEHSTNEIENPVFGTIEHSTNEIENAVAGTIEHSTNEFEDTVVGTIEHSTNEIKNAVVETIEHFINTFAENTVNCKLENSDTGATDVFNNNLSLQSVQALNIGNELQDLIIPSKSKKKCVKVLFSSEDKDKEKSIDKYSDRILEKKDNSIKQKASSICTKNGKSEAEYVLKRPNKKSSLTNPIVELRKIPDTEFKRTTRSIINTEEVDNERETNDHVKEEKLFKGIEETKRHVEKQINIRLKKQLDVSIFSFQTQLILPSVQTRAHDKKLKRAPLLRRWENDIESSLDEKEYFPALSLLKDNLSSFYYPTPKIMSRFLYLLKEQNEAFKRDELFCTLQSIPLLHPVKDIPDFYALSLKKAFEDEDGNVKPTHGMHELLLSTANEMVEMSYCDRRLSGHYLLLDHLVSLMEGNFLDISRYIKKELEKGTDGKELMKLLKKTLLYRFMWEEPSRLLKDFAQFFISIYDENNTSTKIVKLRKRFAVLVQWMIECCSLKDRLADGYYYGNSSVNLADIFTTEIVQLFRTTDTSFSTKQIFLVEMSCEWLKCRACEVLIKQVADPGMIPKSKRNLLAKKISLDKIIYCFFFMWPGTLKKRQPKITTLLSSKMQPLSPISPKKVNKRNGKGETPLHVACNKKNLRKIEQLLSLGAEINTKDNAGWTPLHEACCYGHVNVVDKLLKSPEIDLTYTRGESSGAVDGTTVLHDAVASDQLSIVKILLEKGGEELMTMKNDDGLLPIDLAISKEMNEFLKSYVSNQNRLINTFSLDKDRYESMIKPEPRQIDEYFLVLQHLISSYLQSQHKDVIEDYGILKEQFNLFNAHVILFANKLSLKNRIQLKIIKNCLSLS